MSYRFLRFPEGKGKAVTLSYDDGVRDDLKMVDVLNRHGVKCTFNHTNAVYMTKDEIVENILSKGHEIAIHGAEHQAEGLLRPIEGIEDVLSCRKELENKFRLIIRGMAYPDSGIRNLLPGVTYENIKMYLKNLDIVYTRTLGADNNRFRLPNDWYAWTPTAHHNNPELEKYMDEFLQLDVSEQYSSDRFPRLFYLWGHSYEFERNDNWGLLEHICDKLSGKSDVWYATNMEIYHYVQAYRALSFSADGQIVYNPTLYTVWFEIEGKQYSVQPGKTLFLS